MTGQEERRVYLASSSPRRVELLRQIGIEPVVLSLRQRPPRVDVDETPRVDETPEEHVLRVARLKAEAGLTALRGRRLPPLPVVAADTTVVLDGEILGKPASPAQAAAWLRRYSGREHRVHTAVAVAWREAIETALSTSTVRFRTLHEAEITAYVASGEPLDKAGGYGIQGRAAVFIEHLAGSYSGVMGLPLSETARLLGRFGFEVL